MVHMVQCTLAGRYVAVSSPSRFVYYSRRGGFDVKKGCESIVNKYSIVDSLKNSYLHLETINKVLISDIYMPSFTLEYEDAYKIFADRLRGAREMACLTQKQVAKAIKRPQSFVAKCETGERRVDFIELMLFISVYKIDIGYFEEAVLPLVE